MKKLLIYFVSIIILGITILGIKYLKDISYSGSKSIIIIKNYDQISSLANLVSLNEFKNKVLYIDLWGVHCGPCIQEFSHLSELKNRYKESEIEFIYLATPYGHIYDTQKWKAAIKKYNLEGYNMLMNIDFYYNIWEEVPEMKDPFTIPHYLIVDKQGIIVNANAPRPSKKTILFVELDQLL